MQSHYFLFSELQLGSIFYYDRGFGWDFFFFEALKTWPKSSAVGNNEPSSPPRL